MELRERRRIETARLIRKAALRLAREQDPDAVTIEAICAEAGVSRRTFFNYFAVKEAAFVSEPPPFSEAAIARFEKGEGSLLDGLIELLSSRLPTSEADRQALRLMQDLMSRQARIAAMQISAFHEHERELADLISNRRGVATGQSDALVISAATLAATRIVLADWAVNGQAGASPDLRAGLECLRWLAGE